MRWRCEGNSRVQGRSRSCRWRRGGRPEGWESTGAECADGSACNRRAEVRSGGRRGRAGGTMADLEHARADESWLEDESQSLDKTAFM